MPSRTLPGLGLVGYWPVGSDGWNVGHDENLRKLSALTQCSVASRTTALPASPADGIMYIVPSTAAENRDKIAIRDAGAWVYLDPAEGYLVWIKDVDAFVSWSGSAWVPVQSGGASSTLSVNTRTADYTLVLSDSSGYVRMNAASANVLTVPTDASVPFEIGTAIHVRQVGTGKTTVAPAGGVTINTPESLTLRKQQSSASLIKVAADEWDMTGDLEVS